MTPETDEVTTSESEITMVKALDRFLFGLCFGMGFFIAKAVLDLIGELISRA